MKKYQKESSSLKHEDSFYRKKYRDKLDFSLDDMQSFWDDIYNRKNKTSLPNAQ